MPVVEARRLHRMQFRVEEEVGTWKCPLHQVQRNHKLAVLKNGLVLLSGMILFCYGFGFQEILWQDFGLH